MPFTMIGRFTAMTAGSSTTLKSKVPNVDATRHKPMAKAKSETALTRNISRAP